MKGGGRRSRKCQRGLREQHLRPLGSPPPIVSKARTTHVAVHRRRIHHSVESATSDARAVWRPIEDVRPAYPRDRTKAISDDDRLTDFPLPDWHKEASSRRAHLGRAGLPLGPNFDAPKAVSGVMVRFDDLMTRCLVRALMGPSQSKRWPDLYCLRRAARTAIRDDMHVLEASLGLCDPRT